MASSSKGGEALQRLAEVDTVVFDKTGTLTEGQPAVTHVFALDGDEATLLRMAAAVERLSEHRLGKAIVRAAANRGEPIPDVDHFHTEPGRGVRGTVGGRQIVVGTAGWLESRGIDVLPLQVRVDEFAREGQTPVLVATDGMAAGVLAVADRQRAEAAAVIDELRQSGLATVMLTGDRETTARTIAAQAGIVDVIAEVRPEGKVDAIRERQARYVVSRKWSKRTAIVQMSWCKSHPCRKRCVRSRGN